MKFIIPCLLSLIVAQPAAAASLAESRMAGVVAGEVLCVLKRHQAPLGVVREEFARITKKLTNADVLDLRAHGEAYLEVVDSVLSTCPARSLPDV